MIAPRVVVKLTGCVLPGRASLSRRTDGSLILEPQSVDAVIEEFADRALSEAEHDDVFRRLDAAADRYDRASA